MVSPDRRPRDGRRAQRPGRRPEGPRARVRHRGFGDSTPASIWHSKWHSPPTRRQIGTPPTGLPQLRAALVCCHHGEFDSKGGGAACLWGALVGALAAGARGPTLEAGPLGLGTHLGQFWALHSPGRPRGGDVPVTRLGAWNPFNPTTTPRYSAYSIPLCQLEAERPEPYVGNSQWW